MTPARLVRRGLSHYWRIHLAVALGVVAATAVLTGALLVGDSVRGSLRTLALDRLGQIDQMLLTDRFFRVDLVEELQRRERFHLQYGQAVPGILLPQGTLEARRDERVERATGILVVGCAPEFWDLQSPQAPRPSSQLGPNEIVLNEPLATELGVSQGDSLILRLPKAHQVPADSPLGRKTDLTASLTELTVAEIIPAEGLGRFALHPSQQYPLNAFLSLATLQEALRVEDRANAIFVSSIDSEPSSTTLLNRLLRPELEDFGLAIHAVRRTYQPPGEPEQLAYEYLQLTSDRLLIETPIAAAAQRAWGELKPQPVLTYLANSLINMQDPDAPQVPYSTVTGIDSTAQLGPLLSADGEPLAELGNEEIVLTQWTADRLRLRPGQRLRIQYFEPETTHGATVEKSADFTVRSIVPLVEPYEGYRLRQPPRYHDRPAWTNDPDLTPTVEGITDQESINNWDPPFPYDPKRIKSEDDEYWTKHRTTPKAYVSLATAQRLWGSRFGRITSLRIPAAPQLDAHDLAVQLLTEMQRSEVSGGLEFTPIRQRAIDASSGTTQFDMLFLALSFFLIVSAILLVALLFRLGVEQRSREIGVLLATGWTPDSIGRQLASEGAIVATIGGLLGVAVGLGYAWLLLAGLRTWWLGAVTTPFLTMHVTPLSLIIGFSSGVLVTTVVITVSLRQTRHASIRSLLSGVFQPAAPRSASQVSTSSHAPRGRSWSPWIAAALLGLALVLAGAATQLTGEAQAGSFVGAGLCLLAGLLVEIRRRLRSYGTTLAQRGANDSPQLTGLTGLALRNAARHPGRSTITIGLVGIAVFLIVALSAFRLAPTESGTGGFDLVADSAQPILADLMSDEVRDEVFADQADRLANSQIFGFRVRPGDDASCTNLYQARQPRLLGVTRRFVEWFDQEDHPAFAWGGAAASDPATQRNPWRNLLREPGHTGEAIPVILDKNTALYSLHLFGGIGQEFSIPYDEGELRFRVVGLLANSLLQGALLIDEAEFTRQFPQVSGYRFFLARAGVAPAAELSALLEDRLSDQGLDVRPTRQVLEGFLAVQNTYLSTFQSLGALGLLLGTFGLATVQVRSVVERRGELALLRAAGFRRRRLGALVLSEHLALLLGGMAVGLGSALLAVLPHWWSGGASVPWKELVPMLSAILAVGLAAGGFAVRAALASPLIAALRGE